MGRLFVVDRPKLSDRVDFHPAMPVAIAKNTTWSATLCYDLITVHEVKRSPWSVAMH
jgi:hypothetical protein